MTAFESLLSQFQKSLRKNDFFQRTAALERAVPDLSNRSGEDNRFQSLAAGERAAANRFETVGQLNLRQADTVQAKQAAGGIASTQGSTIKWVTVGGISSIPV